MVATELILGVLGASVSLGSGLLKTFKKHAPRQESGAVITIHMGETTLQKKGSIQPEDVPKVLGFVDDSPVPAQAEPALEDSDQPRIL